MWLATPRTLTTFIELPGETVAVAETAVPVEGVAVTVTDEIAPPVGTDGKLTSTFSHMLPEPIRPIVGRSGLPSSTGVTVAVVAALAPREFRFRAVMVTVCPLTRP